jgi:hypothetical protein
MHTGNILWLLLWKYCDYYSQLWNDYKKLLFKADGGQEETWQKLKEDVRRNWGKQLFKSPLSLQNMVTEL